MTVSAWIPLFGALIVPSTELVVVKVYYILYNKHVDDIDSTRVQEATMLDQDTKDFVKALRRYRTLNSKKSAIEQEMDCLKQSIVKYLDKHEIDSYKGNNICVERSNVSRKQIDRKLVMAALGTKDVSTVQKVITYTKLQIR